MAIAVSPVSSLYTPYVQATLNVTGSSASKATEAASSTTAASSTQTGATSGTSSTADTFAAELAASRADARATLLSQAFGQSELLSRASALGPSNLSSLALVSSLFSNGATAGVFSYPSVVSMLPTFLQQLQNANVSGYTASGLIRSVQSLGTLFNVSA